MLDLLEQAALHDYPNPKRIGCPGPDFLKRLATDRKSIQLTDPALEHVTRCSPCFREFLGFRDAVKHKRYTRRALIASGAAVAAAVAGFAVKLSISPGSDSNGFEHAKIDLLSTGGQRGPDSQAQRPASEASLPRKRLDLEITLPFASPLGDYELQVLRANGQPTGVKASGKAYLLDGKTTLRLRIDLSSLPPDQYQIGFRRIPFDWLPVPIQVR